MIRIAMPGLYKYNYRMLIARAALILTFGLLLQVFAGCSTAPDTANSNVAQGQSNTTSNAGSESNDNIDELGLIVRLTEQPEDVSWREGPPADANKGLRKLTAVLRYAEPEAERVEAEAGKSKPAFENSIATETWFPPELRAKGETSGEGNLPGRTYPADEFLQPPFTEGQLTRINETNYFILEAFAR